MKKIRKIKSIVLRAFIVIAVMMLISVMPGEDKNVTKITEKLIICYNC